MYFHTLFQKGSILFHFICCTFHIPVMASARVAAVLCSLTFNEQNSETIWSVLWSCTFDEFCSACGDCNDGTGTNTNACSGLQGRFGPLGQTCSSSVRDSMPSDEPSDEPSAASVLKSLKVIEQNLETISSVLV